MKHVHCSDCQNKVKHENFGANSCGCLAQFLPISASPSMTIGSAMNMTVKNLHLSRMCEEFVPSMPTLTDEVGAIA